MARSRFYHCRAFANDASTEAWLSGKVLSLHNDGRAGLAIVTSRRDGHQISASHRRRTRRPIPSIAGRRAHDPGRGRRPALRPVVGRRASEVRNDEAQLAETPVRASAAASSSSVRLALSWISQSVTRYGNVTRDGPEGLGPAKFQIYRRVNGKSCVTNEQEQRAVPTE